MQHEVGVSPSYASTSCGGPAWRPRGTARRCRGGWCPRPRGRRRARAGWSSTAWARRRSRRPSRRTGRDRVRHPVPARHQLTDHLEAGVHVPVGGDGEHGDVRGSGHATTLSETRRLVQRHCGAPLTSGTGRGQGCRPSPAASAAPPGRSRRCSTPGGPEWRPCPSTRGSPVRTGRGRAQMGREGRAGGPAVFGVRRAGSARAWRPVGSIQSPSARRTMFRGWRRKSRKATASSLCGQSSATDSVCGLTPWARPAPAGAGSTCHRKPFGACWTICCRYEKPSGTIAYLPKRPGRVSEPPLPRVVGEALWSALTCSLMVRGTTSSPSSNRTVTFPSAPRWKSRRPRRGTG